MWVGLPMLPKNIKERKKLVYNYIYYIKKKVKWVKKNTKNNLGFIWKCFLFFVLENGNLVETFIVSLCKFIL